MGLPRSFLGVTAVGVASHVSFLVSRWIYFGAAAPLSYLFIEVVCVCVMTCAVNAFVEKTSMVAIGRPGAARCSWRWRREHRPSQGDSMIRIESVLESMQEALASGDLPKARKFSAAAQGHGEATLAQKAAAGWCTGLSPCSSAIMPLR